MGTKIFHPMRRDRGEFYAKWTRLDVQRSRDAGGKNAVAVWAALRAIAGARTSLSGPAAPTLDYLAQTLRMSRRVLQETISNLETAGMLSVDRPAGRKPTWTLFVEISNPGGNCLGLPVENADRPRQILPTTLADSADHPGRFCTPAPPIESIENREIRNIGDDELRKSSSDERTGEISPRVRRLGDLYWQLLAQDPNSEDAAALEELLLSTIEDGTEDDRARKHLDELIELAEQAVRLSPNLQEADA